MMEQSIRCVHCGAETKLYVYKTPICITCDDEKQIARKVRNSQEDSKAG